jgi:hypothetical protein
MIEHLLGLLGGLSHLLLDDLLLLNQESSNNSLSNARVASGASVGAGHGALSVLGVLERVVARGSHVLDLLKKRRDKIEGADKLVLNKKKERLRRKWHNKLTPGRTVWQSPQMDPLRAFLMYWAVCLPPT